MKGTVLPSSSSSSVRATFSTGKPRSRATCPRSIEVVVVMQTSNLRTYRFPPRVGPTESSGESNLTPSVVKRYDDRRMHAGLALGERHAGSVRLEQPQLCIVY